MFDELIELAIAAGVAIIGDKVVKKTTGKHIHEHVFEWWCDLRDCIANWLTANRHLGVTDVALVVLDKIDGMAVRTKRMLDKITLAAVAFDKYEKETIIESREVPIEEVYERFPELRKNPLVIYS